LLIGTFGVGIASLDSFIKASEAVPGYESHSEPRRLPAITMESCPPSAGTASVIGWNTHSGQRARTPDGAHRRSQSMLRARWRVVSCPKSIPPWPCCRVRWISLGRVARYAGSPGGAESLRGKAHPGLRQTL